MYRFYIEKSDYDGTYSYIRGGDYNHIKNVLRLKTGNFVVTCDGEGTDYVGVIDSFTDSEVIVEVKKVQSTGNELPLKVYLFQGIPKKDKMELIVQKTVELGVFQVIPVKMHRSVAKIDDKKKDKKTERWQKIAEAAAKQSDRGIIPTVHEPMSFKEALAYAKDLDINLIPYEMCSDDKENSNYKDYIKEATKCGSVGIFIGPEGGIADEELEIALKEGLHEITLGKRILRTETAGFMVLSALVYLLELAGD
ncbi:MAG: 16S rRNA (uracil(1498)-N(3))-methyltransferase [Lachnospiraceae bacterium]|nr:16S rRNA (uracil(1498)-N(3))-methyltransferase [Lachnospiraceae bacterium]